MIEFAASYAEARSRFLEAVGAFEAATGRRCSRARHVVVEGADLTVDAAHSEPQEGGRRLFLVASGVHGVEGYAGNAIQRALLAGPLVRLAADCGVMLVHAVNPWGMAHFRRVNPNNVDLNRNFAAPGEALYRSENPGYRLIAETLAPGGPCDGALQAQLRLLGGLAGALLVKGFATLKQALLAGQYEAPEGLFYGGTEPQPEARIFAKLFAPLCERYDEILLVDLHTGYGEHGRVILLCSHADSREALDGVTWSNEGYVVTGDLVGYCRGVAKRTKPAGIFDGLVLELGTTGRSLRSQLGDLGSMVRENRLHRHGARSPAIEQTVKTSFRELFCPSDPAWRRQSVAAASASVEKLLARRGWLAPQV
jgi:predicted deacylase